ncbi:hypothetical protein ThrDRAFT_04472, partial [Frankia casuarinae]
ARASAPAAAGFARPAPAAAGPAPSSHPPDQHAPNPPRIRRADAARRRWCRHRRRPGEYPDAGARRGADGVLGRRPGRCERRPEPAHPDVRPGPGVLAPLIVRPFGPTRANSGRPGRTRSPSTRSGVFERGYSDGVGRPGYREAVGAVSFRVSPAPSPGAKPWLVAFVRLSAPVAAGNRRDASFRYLKDIFWVFWRRGLVWPDVRLYRVTRSDASRVLSRTEPVAGVPPCRATSESGRTCGRQRQRGACRERGTGRPARTAPTSRAVIHDAVGSRRPGPPRRSFPPWCPASRRRGAFRHRRQAADRSGRWPGRGGARRDDRPLDRWDDTRQSAPPSRHAPAHHGRRCRAAGTARGGRPRAAVGTRAAVRVGTGGRDTPSAIASYGIHHRDDRAGGGDPARAATHGRRDAGHG